MNKMPIYFFLVQAQKLTQCPMGILAKAAPILTDENFTDILPATQKTNRQTTVDKRHTENQQTNNC
jgi:hypothetical protein